MKRSLVLVLAGVTLVGCDGDSSSEPQPSMDEVVASIAEIPSVTEVVRLTEDNDPNDLLGHPDGYDHAAVFIDSRRPRCTAPGIDCGAFLEVWGDAEEAKARSQYLRALLEGTPVLGSEVHFRSGPHLLRVSGELKAPAVEEYEAAFNDS